MPTIKTFLSAVGKRPILCGSLLLAAITTLNNWPVSYFDFAWDDIAYIVRNYPIQDPVSFKTAWWCLTQFAEANWHPLTWFALNIQFNCFGLDPRGYHIVNLALHVANVVLLYTALSRATGAFGKSLVVAALFAVHPLHIESLAWISEIKDVLSTFFLMLVLHAHISYSRKPTLGRYGLTFFALALGLMAKPMLVTAPFALLLLDYWPLGRWSKCPAAAWPEIYYPRYGTTRLLLEKLPLVLLVVGSSVLTFLAQRAGGAVAGLDALPLTLRLANVVNSYVLYVWRMAWPWPLSFFYPLDPNLPLWRVGGCVLTLAAATAGCLWTRRSKPYLLMGWLWFLGTLVPVIGLVQVGSQGIADRYTYIPSIGLLVAGVWLATGALKRLRLDTLLPPIAAGALVFAYMLVSFEYLGHWENEAELYAYALSINASNTVAHNNYANVLAGRGQLAEAMEHYKSALIYAPKSGLARINLARLQIASGDIEAAEKNIEGAWQSNPGLPQVYSVKAILRALENNTEAVEKLLAQAYVLNPKDMNVLNNLADALMQQGKVDEAQALYQEGLAKAYDKDPNKAYFHNSLGTYWFNQLEYAKAAEAFDKALALQPRYTLASRNLARVLLARHETAAAEERLRKTLTMGPDPVSMSLLGDLRLVRKQYGRAYVWYRRALTVNPLQAEAHEGMAAMLRIFGQPDAATIHAARAVDLRVLLRPSLLADKAKLAAVKNKTDTEKATTIIEKP